MDVHPIRTNVDHRAALKRIEALFEAISDSPQGDELEVLATLVEAHEDQHFALSAPDPVEADSYFIESRGLSRKDLVAVYRQSGAVVGNLEPQAAANAGDDPAVAQRARDSGGSVGDTVSPSRG